MQSDTFPLVKILSGPHKGAEVVVAPGEHDIGLHQDCDIVLSDQTLAPRHARLLVGDSDLRIMALDGIVMVDGAAVGPEPISLKLFATVSIGTTELCVGLQGAHWQPMAITGTAFAAVGSSAPEPVIEASEPAPESVLQSLSHSARALVQNAGILPNEWAGRRLYSWVGMALVTASVALLVDHFANGGVFTSPHLQQTEMTISPVAPDLLYNQVERALAPLELSQLSVSASGENEITIAGYLQSHDDAQRLDNALRRFGRTVKQTIWVRPELVEQANAILRELKLPLEAKDDGAGRIAVSGYVDSTSIWQRAHKTLLRDSPGLREVDGSGIQTRAERASLLRDWLNEDDLQLDIVSASGRLKVVGRIESHTMPALEGTLRRFREQFGDQPSITTDVKPIVSRDTPSTIAIAGTVVSTVDRYLMTQSGDRYRIGEKLPDGYEIEAIEPRHVVLIRNGYRITRHLGSRTSPPSSESTPTPGASTVPNQEKNA